MSIIARDPETGCVGAAVASAQVAPGRRVLHARAGVGVVAAQAESDLSIGPAILAGLECGLNAASALERALDDCDETRLQIGVVAVSGSAAAHTGGGCQGFAGNAVGAEVCAQANLMATGHEWQSMLDAFTVTPGPLARRLITALRAGERSGGDIRGRQGAALVIVTPELGDSFTGWWWDQNLDLRVDDHDDPIHELERLYDAHEGQNLAVESLHLAEGDLHGALGGLEHAAELAPRDPNINYLLAIALLEAGRETDAERPLRRAALRNPNLSLRLAQIPGEDVKQVTSRKQQAE